MDDVRVLVLGDDPLARGGIAAILADQSGIVVAADGPAGVIGVPADVAVLDLGPGQRADTRRIAELRLAGLLVLALAGSRAQAREAWTAGARGVLFRDRQPVALAAAVRAVARGLAVAEPEVVVAPRRAPSPDRLDVEPLTPREMEVLQLLGEGLSNRAIAERLGVRERTAKFHVNAILAKLGVESRTEALVQAARLGLVVL